MSVGEAGQLWICACPICITAFGHVGRHLWIAGPLVWVADISGWTVVRCVTGNQAFTVDNFATLAVFTRAIILAALVPGCRVAIFLVFGTVITTILRVAALRLVYRTAVFIETLRVAMACILFAIVT